MDYSIFLFAGQGKLSLSPIQNVAKKNQLLNSFLTPIQSLLSIQEDNLLSTTCQQPLQALASLALYKTLATPNPIVAGFSLGELPALAAAGVLAENDLENFIQQRATSMFNCYLSQEKLNPQMLAILANPIDPIINIIKKNPIDNLYIANDNSSRQVVVAGTETSIRQLQEILHSSSNQCQNYKMVPLQTQGAFHSPLMKSAEDELATYVAKLPLQPPTIPFFSSVSGKRETDPEAIRALLQRQLTSPVLWRDTMQSIQKFCTQTQAVECSLTPMLQNFWRHDVENGQCRQAISLIPLNTKIQLEFSPEDPIYSQHFEGYPVVPGSLILETFINILEHEFPDKKITLERIKFSKFVRPKVATLELLQTQETVTCTLFQDDEKTTEARFNLL